MRKLLSSLSMALLWATFAFAQEHTVTGTVTASEDGLTLPGVSIQIKGTTTGTQTGPNGQYSIRIPGNNAVLVFSYIGFASQEVNVGTRGVVNVALSSDATQLGEVVVTALGVTRQERTLGYSSTTVKADEITAARNATVMSGLQGKIAGVQISNAGTPGGSTKVVIRGISSLAAGNNPLYVIDGVPVNNAFRGTGNSTYTPGENLSNLNNSFERTADFGNQANDINPEDVESVTVLKGASATALYGSRAAHGVIVITTKKGKKNQKLNVTYTGAFNASTVLRTPQTQSTFGQGWPYFDDTENGSWGPKLNGQTLPWGSELNGEKLTKPFSYIEDNVRNFYQTGTDFVNSINISGGNENNSFVLSYSNAIQDGVIPTSADNFKRNTVSLRGNTTYGKFQGNYSINYVRKDQRSVFGGQGTSDGGATLFQELIQTPVDIPISDLEDYNNPYHNSDNYYSAYSQNPYFVINENGAGFQDDRVYGRIELSYDIIKNLKAIGRLGTDFSNTRGQDWAAAVTYSPGSRSSDYHKQEITGRYGENYRKDGQIDAQLLLTGDYNLNSDITLNATAGFNYNQRTSNLIQSYVTGTNINGWRSLSNANTSPQTASGSLKRRLFGALGQLDFGFKDYFFVNVSLRNDWSSTLPINNNSFFYGGVNSSLVLTDMFSNLKNDKISLLKLRAAWGQTGNDAPVYRVNGGFTPSQINLGFGSLYLPLNGVAGLSESNRLGNSNLKPEITTEWELGADLRFFNSRLGLDVAYYNRHTKDQIISANYAPETGYTSQTLNVGNIQNNGIEALLSVVPIKTTDWIWDLGINFTRNRSEVKSLYGDTKELLITSAYSVDYYAEIGKPLGVFKVPDYEYVKEGPQKGKIVVQANGLPKIDPNAKIELGSSQPNFIMGFNNKVNYKNLSLSVAIDWRNGGKFYSYTKQLQSFVGNTTESTFNERQPFLVPNSAKEVTSGGVTNYVENNNMITFSNIWQYYSAGHNTAIFRNFVIDRDYLKLREVVLNYRLPSKLIAKLRGVGSADFSLIGRNLLLFTPKSNHFVDPEGSNYGNDIYSEFGEFATAPTMRTFGASLKLTF
ncbi:MAG: SusC/RagA family TonB-linked outer membrane protein [Sphingobacteriaceae bacterium]